MAYLETRRVFWSDGAGRTTSPVRRVFWRTSAGVEDHHTLAEASSATSSVGNQFFDSHCHLDLLLEREGGSASLTEYMRRARVGFPTDFGGCLTVFCRPNHWSRSSRWMNLLEDSRVYGAFGCHPHRATEWNGHTEAVLIEILRSHPRVVAVGEMGLDFSRNNHVPSDVQRKAFQRQLQIAINEEMPAVLHLREAEREGLEMMQRMVPRGHPMHWHCVTGQWPLIRMCQEQFDNSYFGFTPLIYNVNASNARMVAKALPLDRILIESDAPHFLPQEHRGRTRWSHPGMSEYVTRALADLHDTNRDCVKRQTRENAKRLYGIDMRW
ncbi:putative deoxyribonuclease TATDN2 [Amphibalanus amphitrite]|uniref:putative deoxyribonuclease TATDN2 n=1 Tax=Amphibalanus amphitrite TaxID=1232801 RepID=UPI001C916C45|nr:putative deoxyribonuclease TATDN2 [Amphibalanus amphitrite]